VSGFRGGFASKPTMTRIPKLMRAAAIDMNGPPEVLSIHLLPVPAIDPDEILIAIDTAGVGPWDAEIREGELDGEAVFPLILGTDGSGSVAATGEHVRHFATGEQVYSYSFNNPKGGFYAEYVAVKATKAAHVPKSLDLERAGAVATVGLTAIQGIDDHLRIRRGERVIVHGASGGVGHLGLQFAKFRGAEVFATASGPDGVEFATRLGADAAVDGRHGDIGAAALDFAPDGVDAVFALIGGDSLEQCLDALRPGGRLAYPNGVEPIPRKRKGIEVEAYDAIAGKREFDHLNRVLDEAKPVIAIAARYPLDDAAEAHRRLEKGHVFGKIVLNIRDPENPEM
jgi:NADPH2:quinone reductase